MYFIFNKYDASLKTTTCKVPGSEYSACGSLYKAYIIQAMPILYPKGNAGYYNTPVISVNGYFGDGTYKVDSCEVYMTKCGSLLSSDSVYSDGKNPITCKCWYFDM